MTDHRRQEPQNASGTANRRRKLDKQQIDELLDEALKGTFPASDPIALTPRRPARQQPS